MMEHIDKMNRAQLVDDAMNLARADQLPYTIGKKSCPKNVPSTNNYTKYWLYFRE